MPEKISEFWYTAKTMCRVYGYDVVGFEMYGAVHIFWLVLCVVLCAAGSFFYRRSGEKTRRAVLWSIVGILAAFEIVQDIVMPLTGQWEWQFLPLQLCSINLFVCLWYAIRPNDTAGELLYAVCLPGALAALLSPSWTQVPVYNFVHLHSSIHHVLLILFPVLLLAGGFKPSIKRLWKAALILALACVPIYFINILLNENFFFINGDNGNPVLVFCGKLFPDYRIGMAVIALIIWTVLYLPWLLAEKKRKYDR